ncbi:helix-turn-helix domain-containing protein [Fictibacillus fluitans]|uniref:Helix-turn-helix domain-containing protein n=1 Tax=Fictibacillus fluitans TaxID=3058422 RepID=A0ABT8HYF1_9BACL|nr:helix-turn-helix domain-containing protein [Fictibacillus sp. NE201]MDN4525810.1 helix-turn-helix domain-containing protein [Fictibacillus sp. NE201]
MNDLKQIEEYCSLLTETFNIPFYYVNHGGELQFETASHTGINPLYSSKQTMLKQLMELENPSILPLYTITPYYENFFSLPVCKNKKLAGTLIAGPTIDHPLKEETLIGLINDLPLAGDKRLLSDYYQSIPVISEWNKIHISKLLYHMLYKVKLDTKDILHNNRLMKDNSLPRAEIAMTVSKRRQNNTFHTSPLIEKKVFQYIKEGRKEDLIEVRKKYFKKEGMGVLSRTSHIRSQKNLAIVGITLATRYAVDGGLYPEIAYTLSDKYIQNIEELTDVNEVWTLVDQAHYSFADRVDQLKRQTYSKPVITCQNYIFSHIYDELKVAELANMLKLHPNYLSLLFKKETGMSITSYIQKAKVDEAKNLLTFSHYSVSEIYTLLNFHDQSYFTKVFKKLTGETPSQFRNQKKSSF